MPLMIRILTPYYVTPMFLNGIIRRGALQVLPSQFIKKHEVAGDEGVSAKKHRNSCSAGCCCELPQPWFLDLLVAAGVREEAVGA